MRTLIYVLCGSVFLVDHAMRTHQPLTIVSGLVLLFLLAVDSVAERSAWLDHARRLDQLEQESPSALRRAQQRRMFDAMAGGDGRALRVDDGPLGGLLDVE